MLQLGWNLYEYKSSLYRFHTENNWSLSPNVYWQFTFHLITSSVFYEQFYFFIQWQSTEIETLLCLTMVQTEISPHLLNGLQSSRDSFIFKIHFIHRGRFRALYGEVWNNTMQSANSTSQSYNNTIKKSFVWLFHAPSFVSLSFLVFFLTFLNFTPIISHPLHSYEVFHVCVFLSLCQFIFVPCVFSNPAISECKFQIAFDLPGNWTSVLACSQFAFCLC